MPSAFTAEFLADAAPDLINTFGEPVTYYPHNGQSRIVLASVARLAKPLEDGQSHDTRVETCTLVTNESEAERDDLTEEHGGILDPKLRDAMLFEGEDAAADKWDFQRVVDRSGGMITTEWTRSKLERHGRPTPRAL